MLKQAPDIRSSSSASSGTAHVPATRPTRVIAITSGKGGVGKTSLTTNLGIALAKQGAKVCILDADTGLANINILLNLQPEYTLEQLLSGEKELDEIMLDGPNGIKVVPAASGIIDCVDLDQKQQKSLAQALEILESRFDYLLIDTAAGIGDTVLQFLASAQYCILVISAEPTSLTDAFALVRVMKRKKLTQPIYAIVNRVSSPKKGNEVFHRFSSAVKKYLHTRVGHMGCIAEDAAISNAVCLQMPIVIAQPQSLASRCIFALAERIDTRLPASPKSHHFSRYWKGKHGDRNIEVTERSKSPPPLSTQPNALSGDYLAIAILAYLQYPETSEKEAQHLLQPLIDAGLKRFGHSAFKLPPPQAPGIASDIGRLLSDIEEPEAAEIIQQIITRHERLYKKSPLDIETTLVDTVRQTDISELQFATVIETLQQHYRDRFGDIEENEKARMLDSFNGITQRIQQQEERLDKDLLRLSQLVQEFSASHLNKGD